MRRQGRSAVRLSPLQARIHPLVLTALLTLAGCSATEIVNQWSNPAYPSASFKEILIIGVSNQTSIRRTFEDEFVSQLKAAGLNAAPSYQFIHEDGPVDESRLKQAVEQAGADAAIVTRLIGVEQKTGITPGYYHSVPAYGFYRWYSSAWSGFYEPPRVYQYDVYVSETSLYDMVKNEVVWSGAARTTASSDVGKEIKRYVETVIRALGEKKLLDSK